MSTLDVYAPQGEVAAEAPSTPVVTVFDHANQVKLDLPEADLEAALASGQYTLPKNHEISVISPDGVAGTIPSENIHEAIKNGFKLEQADARREREVEAKYGDRELEATAQGAARGLTFGLSDVVQTKTGFRSPEELSGLEEANPIASGAGEVGGVVGGLFMPVGLVAGAGVKGAAKTAQLVERGLAKQLAKAGVKQTVAKAMVEKIAPAIVGSAVEGAFYGGGKLISENALGRADFNAENLVGYLGTGALIGGGATGVLKGAGMLLEPVAQKIAPGVKYVADKIENKFFDKSRAATELGGYTPSQAAKLAERDPTFVAGVSDFFKNRVGMKIGDSMDDIVAKTEAVKRSAGETIDDVLTKLEQSGVRADRQIFENAAEQIRAKIAPYVGTPGFETAVARASKYADDVNALVVKAKDFGPKELQKIRQQTDELINFGKRADELPMIQEAAYTMRTAMRGEIDKIAEKVDPGLLKALKDANKDYHFSSELLPNMSKKAERADFMSLKDAVLGAGGAAVGGPAGVLAAGAGKFANSDLRRKMVILSSIENAQQKVYGQMKKSVDAFFSGTKKLSPVTTQSLIRSELSHDLSVPKPKAPKTREAAFNNIRTNLEQYAANPEALMQRTNRVTAALYGGAPETSAAVDMTVSNAVQFLASKLPRRSTSGGVLDMLKKPSMPSNYEMAKFERYLEAVEQPVSVLKEFESGTATREGVEALKAVYPAMYSGLRDLAVEKLAEDGQNMSYQKKLQIGLLLDIPADESLMPQNILGLQAQFNTQNPPVTGAVAITEAGLSSLNGAARAATTLQAPDELS